MPSRWDGVTEAIDKEKDMRQLYERVALNRMNETVAVGDVTCSWYIHRNYVIVVVNGVEHETRMRAGTRGGLLHDVLDVERATVATLVRLGAAKGGGYELQAPMDWFYSVPKAKKIAA